MFFKVLSSAASVALLLSQAYAYTGDGTYYYQGGAYGACGSQSQDSQLVAALSSSQYSGGSNCYKRVNIHYGGHSVQATVVDLCAGCASGSIDLSPTAFEQLAPLSVGRLHGVTWEFA